MFMFHIFKLCNAFLQRRYILKFATDGAVLTNRSTKNAVQGTMKLIPADCEGKVTVDSTVPEYLYKEITLYYYLGKSLKFQI